jgi:hypothetical protein
MERRGAPIQDGVHRSAASRAGPAIAGLVGWRWQQRKDHATPTMPDRSADGLNIQGPHNRRSSGLNPGLSGSVLAEAGYVEVSPARFQSRTLRNVSLRESNLGRPDGLRKTALQRWVSYKMTSVAA